MAKKVAFINNKGGSAKTTTTVNLAGAYARNFASRRVLIVEGDGQGNATRSFGLSANDYDKTMYDVFMGNNKPEECIIEVYQNIDLLPANSDMNFVEFDEMNRYDEKIKTVIYDMLQSLADRNIDLKNLSRDTFDSIVGNVSGITDNYFNMLDGKFDEIEKNYDLILFDTPPELKAITSSILAICDEAVIPFEPDTYSIDGVKNILSRTATIKKQINQDLRIAGILATKVRQKTVLHNDVTKAMIKYANRINIRYFDTEIPNSIRFASSTTYNGLPATLTMRNNKFVDSYYELLNEMVESGML